MAEPSVTVVVGAESVVVRGRAALLIGLLVRHAERVNATPVGKLVASFAHQQMKLELRESLPPGRLSEQTARGSPSHP